MNNLLQLITHAHSTQHTHFPSLTHTHIYTRAQHSSKSVNHTNLNLVVNGHPYH